FPSSNAANWQERDARTDWLVDLLTSTREKFLLICSRAETAIALERYIRDRTTVRSVAFHEGLDLVARDRAANYFAESERGAQVLVCSEIGSEGRNFQFAHHLIMFDLPPSPDLIEQRIGRLDRIGQSEDVIIHIPFAEATEQALLLRIFNEGFSLFDAPNAAAQLIFDELPTLDSDRADNIVEQARNECDLRTEALSTGRDRLIELNSHDPAISDDLLEEITTHGVGDDLETYLESSFDLVGLESEVISDKIFNVKPTESMVRHSPVSAETQDRYRYPELPDDGLTYTFDRQTALAREDVHYFTWENPLVEQALDLVVSDITGNCTVIVVKIPGVKTGTMMLESLHVIECIAPADLGADRYLPPRVVRSMITTQGTDVAGNVAYQAWENPLEIDHDAIAKIIAQQEGTIRRLISKAEDAARQKFEPMQADALSAMTAQLDGEIQRLRALAEINPNVRQDEIEFLESSRQELAFAIEKSQVRLDAVRLFFVA
ncbi:MAG: RNA polymerase-associated protein RapA, partial [Gammaproteobacteria bacterium]|nr:RNA polymerase-associated protein RapA [Gammaproteobacteria bacterium]